MARGSDLSEKLDALDAALVALNVHVKRLRNDLAAVKYHATGRGATDVPSVVLLGGTGTGKSTLINRLLKADVSATSFRRTHTAGAIAFVPAGGLPAGWLGIEPRRAAQTPARGEIDVLTIVQSDAPPVLVDTPDLDGELPAHHAQADRAFRWADAVVFLVTPEKYQMTELLGYYRLAARYGVPAVFVMNKTTEQPAVDDYAGLLGRQGIAGPRVFALPRDDSAFAAQLGLDDLRATLPTLKRSTNADARRRRASDLAGRVEDQLLAPLRSKRQQLERAAAALTVLGGDGAVGAAVDVHPLTRGLQRRLQQKSVLYLMGPGKMIDRLRDVPGTLVRLPRSVWDLARHGATTPVVETGERPWKDAPDFAGALVDQFLAFQSRIDDTLSAHDLPGHHEPRSSANVLPIEESSVTVTARTDADWKIPPDEAGLIATEEIEKLKTWLETRWNGTPRDTALLYKLLNVIPGARKLTKYSEAAPYLLTLACVAHGAIFGHLDLMILGGYTVATWLSERVSNEVASRTKATNIAIGERFERLALDQLGRARVWLDARAPSQKLLDAAERANAALVGD